MSRLSLALLCACAAGASPPVAAQAEAARGTAFNPKISLILDSLYADYRSDTGADIGGVLLAPETEPAPAGFSVGETELVVESNIDDQWHGWATVALENESGDTVVALEEAYVNTLALPAGLAVKLGRFKSDIGYLNRIHAHAWEFTDAPVAYRALLGTQLQDDGVQVRWIAPTDLLVEVGAEALRGQAYPAGGETRDGINSVTGFVHLGGDLGTGASWRVGLSHLRADADARATGEDVKTLFTGKSDVSIADLVFKWAPNGNPARTNFVFNAEFLRRAEKGDLTYDPDGADPANPGPLASAYDGTQQGWYAQAIYQFLPRWRAGLRHDALAADNTLDNPVPGTALGLLADDSYDPRRDSVMVDFSNSEFSRIRLQYNNDRTRPGGDVDDQFFVQFVYSLGAHPAHQF